jgi:hypothetical protein
MRQSRSYGRSLQNFPPPKSGIGCDTCGRRIAVSAPDPSTGAKRPLKPFEMAIGVGAKKGCGNQGRQSTLSGIVGIRRVQICPESRLAGRRMGNQQERQPPTLDNACFCEKGTEVRCGVTTFRPYSAMSHLAISGSVSCKFSSAACWRQNASKARSVTEGSTNIHGM